MAGTERIFDGASILGRRRVEWAGMRGELLTAKRDRILENEMLTGSHVLFMGIEGALHPTSVVADGVPDWRGVKGQGLSAFFAAGRRMRSWHDPGQNTTLVLMFDDQATADLIGRERAIAWHSRPSADHPFIAAVATELAAALRDEGSDLAALHAETLATSLHLHSIRRFAEVVLPELQGGETVDQAIELIHAHLPRAVCLTDLVATSRLPRARFLSAFRGKTGLTPHQYIIRERLDRAKFLLATTDHSVSQVAVAVGCANPEHLGQMFRQHLDMSPRVWRHRHDPRRH